MIVSLIRGFIAYLLLVVGVRLMGKRQIGELQPADLVITILISEIAAIPIEESEAPLLSSVTNVIFLVSIEIFVSYISMKSTRFRRALQGNSVMIIENGNIKEKELKQIRLTIDDLTEALRQKDIFDITEVSYAYAETNGSISAELFPENKTVTAGQANIETQNDGIPVVVVSDGRVIGENFRYCFLDDEKLERELEKRKLKKSDILLMTADRRSVGTIVLKGAEK
ncbi:MAG: DUF421 domain-containing protein [Acutalibacteraceae bacterium]|nr:DUF421 domain-containing protein [Oscillospiraceae bacterium]